MEHVTKKELESYIETIKSNFEGKMRYMFEGIATEVNFNNYGINVEKHEIKKRWGRHGTDFFFKPKNDYYQWFFYGIYFDSNDYKIPLKNDRVPELAFFFDIGYDHNESYLDEIRANLKGKEDLLNALKRLSKKGFEDNLTSNLTPSKWRLLCKRIPLTEIDDFSYERIKEMFEEIMVQLTDETDFKEELM